VVVVAALTAASAIVACGGSKRANEATPPAAPPGATASQINPLPRDQVMDGGRLTWPLDAMPANYNYYQIDGTVLSAMFIVNALVPSAFHIQPNGAPRWNADVLASEPVLVTEPHQVVTYRFNPKARWDDGTPITWEDFYWQWKATNGSDKAYQISSASGYEDIENVARGHDDLEVVVTFKHKYADWQAIFDPFYPASLNKTPQSFNGGWKAKPLVTAGPFKFDHADETAKTVTLVRNERWWGDRAKLDTMVFRAMEINAQIDALANGEIDLMDIGPDANMYNRAKTLPGVDIRVAAGPNFRHITINGTGLILKDVTVRRALAMAINRDALARAMLGPLGIQPRTLGNHIFMANQQGYRDNSDDIGRFDPDKARQLLDQAGWKLDGNTRRKSGQALEIRCVIPSGVATSKQESELIQNMLAQVGIALKIETVPGADFFSKYVTPGQFDVTFFSWIGTPFPISSSRSIYAKPKRGPGSELSIQQNYARIGSDEIDGLFDQATQELDHQKATDLANHLDSLIWQEVHSLTTYQRPELWATKKDVANMGALGMAVTDGPVYQNVGWAKH
jgi:peptide/nickel transport system substrate-binding protein